MADHFAEGLAQAKLATNADIADLIKQTDFSNELKHVNKKISSNKTKHVEAEKKLSDLRKKMQKYQNKDMIFCQVDCYLQVTMLSEVFSFCLHFQFTNIE